jgi:hypothetical protein
VVGLLSCRCLFVGIWARLGGSWGRRQLQALHVLWLGNPQMQLIVKGRSLCVCVGVFVCV